MNPMTIGYVLISKKGMYRYLLSRSISGCTEHAYVNFILLNLSTADAHTNDPTVIRCCGFARRWGYKNLVITNLFALRTANPKELKASPNPVGKHNNNWIRLIAEQADRIVLGWGALGEGRGNSVIQFLPKKSLYCLGITKNLQPKHPLYLSTTTKLIRW